jgi:hypothetical protein
MQMMEQALCRLDTIYMMIFMLTTYTLDTPTAQIQNKLEVLMSLLV